MDQRRIIIGKTALHAFAKASENSSSTMESFETASLESAFGPTPEDVGRARKYLEENLPNALAAIEVAERDGAIAMTEDRLASLLQSFLAEQGAANAIALLDKGKLQKRDESDFYEAKFDEGDIAGWLFSFLPSYLAGRFKKKPFVTPSENVVTIPDEARIAILGDWGSGLYGAPECANTIAKMDPKYDVIVHLGDVYYAGTASEVQDRFLGVWPTVAGAKSFATNSNHEMYSGGEGYFTRTLADPRFAHDSSCFAFQNSNFLFLGLDTAYEDFDLSDEQVRWIEQRIEKSGGRRVVLLSHHQPFSQFEGPGTKLTQKLGHLLTAGKIFAWYWGHEHRCVIFGYHNVWRIWGRCIGHGGYPAFRDNFSNLVPERESAEDTRWFRIDRGAQIGFVLDGPNVYVGGHEKKYSPNGFMSLTLDGKQIREAVLSPSGMLVRTELIL
jgi:hypothetical protein